MILNTTGSPINRDERNKLNENWQRIIAECNRLQSQINILTGEDVDLILERIDTATLNAETTTAEMETLIGQVETKLTEIQTAITNANNATDDANVLNVALTTLKGELETLKTELQGIVDAESIRVSNENTRISNENTRQSNETARQNAESSRVSTFDTQMGLINDALPNVQNLDNRLTWNASTQYFKNNIVEYNGSSFQALQDSLGQTPPTLPTKSNEHWQLLAQRGVDGTGSVVSVNGISPDINGNVSINSTDVGSIPSSEKGVANGVATLNADGKVVDSNGNLVEGKVTSVNGQIGDVVIPDSSTAVKGIVQLNDTLTSTSTTEALTANQGKVLDDKITVLTQDVGDKTVLGTVDKTDLVAGINEINTRLKEIVVNVKDFGAIGDGISHPLSEKYATLIEAQVDYPDATALTDEIDWCAIQKAINHIYSLGGGTIALPTKNHKYVVNNDIIVKGLTGTSAKDIVLEGLGDGKAEVIRTSSIGSDSAIIRIKESGYNIRLKNLFLKGDSNTKYGIYAEIPFAIGEMSNFIIDKVDTGVRLIQGGWVSTYEDFIIRNVVNGFKIEGQATSSFVKNGYIYNATGTAWYLVGTYSTAINLCCDYCSGTAYHFYYAEYSITSLGIEKHNGENAIIVDNSQVIIDNMRIHNNTTTNSVLYNETNSTLRVNSLNVADINVSCKLFDFGWADNSFTYIDEINYTNSTVTYDEESISNISYRAQNFGVKLGSKYYKVTNNNGLSYKREYLMKDGYTDVAFCDTKPSISNGFDMQWLTSDQKGTIYISKDLTNGIFGYVRTDNVNGATFRDSKFSAIPLVTSATTSGRPTANLVVGQTIFDTTLGRPIWWNGTNWVESKNGTLTYNGDGTSITKTIAHGLTRIPTFFQVTPSSADAGTAGIKFVTADVNNLTVTFNTPPITGTNNVKLTWKAEV